LASVIEGLNKEQVLPENATIICDYVLVQETQSNKESDMMSYRVLIVIVMFMQIQGPD
jgi:hypothetical protein